MKKLIIALSMVVALVSAKADPLNGINEFSQYASSGTSIGGTGTNYLIVPVQSGSAGDVANITFLSVRGFSTQPITLQSYLCTNATQITATNTVGLESTNIVASTNGFHVGDAVVIQHSGQRAKPARFQYEYTTVSGFQNTNQLVFSTQPTTPIQVGDKIWDMVNGASISIVSSLTTPTTFNGPGIISGQNKVPLLLTLMSTAATGTNTIDAVNAQFVP